MRELTFKSYLQREMCEQAGIDSKSLYKFAALSERNARLKDVVVLYLSLYVNDNLKRHILARFPYLTDGCSRLSNLTADNVDAYLSATDYSEYKTVYENYLNYKNRIANENELKRIMHKRITELQHQNGITNYAIYKGLDLNPGNVNAFLKNKDMGKVSLNTARRILGYINNKINDQ